MMCIHGSQFPCPFWCIRYTTGAPAVYPVRPTQPPTPLFFFNSPGAPWLCPVCGVGVAPSEKVCPRCVEKAAKKEPA